MAILVTSKYEDDPIKIEVARVATTQNIDIYVIQLTIILLMLTLFPLGYADLLPAVLCVCRQA